MILVTGASGKTGRAIISALTKVRQPVRALIHKQEQITAVQSLGVEETVVGDMRSNATVTRAMQGVESIYHICPNVSPAVVLILNDLQPR
jgi:uncharacterized protein YbjT (DUF2867 family)